MEQDVQQEGTCDSGRNPFTGELNLVNKWKVLLEYTAPDTPELPKEKWEDLAKSLEKQESQYLRYPKLLKKWIPIIRRMEFVPPYTFEMIDKDICLVTSGRVLFQLGENSLYRVALPFDPEQDLHSFAYTPHHIYIFDEQTKNWKWI